MKVDPYPRTFKLIREADESGVSGIGHVADGVVFRNGKCCLSWISEHSSVAVYDCLADVELIHGHNGKTRIVF